MVARPCRLGLWCMNFDLCHAGFVDLGASASGSGAPSSGAVVPVAAGSATGAVGDLDLANADLVEAGTPNPLEGIRQHAAEDIRRYLNDHKILDSLSFPEAARLYHLIIRDPRPYAERSRTLSKLLRSNARPEDLYRDDVSEKMDRLKTLHIARVFNRISNTGVRDDEVRAIHGNLQHMRQERQNVKASDEALAMVIAENTPEALAELVCPATKYNEHTRDELISIVVEQDEKLHGHQEEYE